MSLPGSSRSHAWLSTGYVVAGAAGAIERRSPALNRLRHVTCLLRVRPFFPARDVVLVAGTWIRLKFLKETCHENVTFRTFRESAGQSDTMPWSMMTPMGLPTFFFSNFAAWLSSAVLWFWFDCGLLASIALGIAVGTAIFFATFALRMMTQRYSKRPRAQVQVNRAER